MSPMRIGSIELSVLMMRASCTVSPTDDQLDVPLGLLGGNAGRCQRRRSSIFICGRAPLRRLTSTRTSRRLVVDISDVAIGPVEDVLVLRSSWSRCSRMIVVSVSSWRVKSSSCCLILVFRVGDLGRLLVVGGLKLVDLGQQGAALFFVFLLLGQNIGVALVRRPWSERRLAVLVTLVADSRLLPAGST